MATCKLQHDVRAYHSCTCSRQCRNINPSILPRLLDLIPIHKHQSKRPAIHVHQSKTDNSWLYMSTKAKLITLDYTCPPKQN